MRAVRVDAFGGPGVLEVRTLPDPAPGPGEVLVEVTAANVIFLDTLIRGGAAPDHFPQTPPYVPGGSVVGRVASVGSGADPALVGEPVLTLTEDGGYAERVVVPAEGLVRVPDELRPLDALALLVDGATAMMLERSARFAPDTWVLVLAATGGAGSLVVQLARLAGARVIGAARGVEKLEFARSLGAEEVVDYSDPGWLDRVRSVTGGAGVDVVVDGVGGALGTASFGSVADGGRFLSYGTAGGSFAEVDPAEAERRGVTSLGLYEMRARPGPDRSDLTRLALEEARAGHLRPHVGLTLPLERAAEAHAALEGRRVLGKVLLAPGDS
ncbi:zinc-binding dehydrogenase [Nocardiopsis sp. NPDC006938]|uniref:zinc-binding dehydrogenase n=1 Tax=Nocardiopsis sp. NPDC006938 TaxID=3364337 RepID=UPI0036B1A009